MPPDPAAKGALSTAVQFGRLELVRELLDRGANPNLPEGDTAPLGTALYAAASRGDTVSARMLLAHGADPNSWIDASGSATYAAADPELRTMLLDHGGALDPYDWIWLGEHDRAVEQVRRDPQSADRGCGGVLAAACTLGLRELLERLLAAGTRVPKVLSECPVLFVGATRAPIAAIDPRHESGPARLATGHSLTRPMLPGRPRTTTPPPDTMCRDPARCRRRLARPRRRLPLDSPGLGRSQRATRHGGLSAQAWIRGSSWTTTRPGAAPLAWATRRGHQEVIERLRDT